MIDPQQIRNFSIIAHIDHGKSTLADGLLKLTGTLSDRESKQQFLDSMDIERERGITIKAQTVRLNYKAPDGQVYQMNLIDTPGHVDFSYEVSRSLAACEGALLVVDAASGCGSSNTGPMSTWLWITIWKSYLFSIRLIFSAADPEGVKQQIEEAIGLDTSGIIYASAKELMGIDEILEAVVQKVPPPQADRNRPLRALIFDSWFDSYQGVVILCRIVDGSLKKGDRIKFMDSRQDYEVLKLGVFSPFAKNLQVLEAGEVGFIISGIKDIRDVRVGDTITHLKGANHQESTEPLPGFQKVSPMVFSGLFPIFSTDYEPLKNAMDKLALNDSSLTYEPEKSSALGFGLRCGFLGLLHMEIVQERLEREFNLNLITTAPTVVYRVYTTDGQMQELENPSDLPDAARLERIQEPHVKMTLHTPSEYIGGLLKLCEDRRGIQIKMEYISDTKVIIEYKLPLNEVVMDFYDRLKSISRGYASMEYEILDFEDGDLCKMDVLLNGDPIDALSVITHKAKAAVRGRQLTKKLKELIPRQQYQVAIQASIGSKIVARETLGALRKDVTAKCYGGDITRKRKLLEKQKEGKKRMKQIGRVDVPQEAFLAILKAGD